MSEADACQQLEAAQLKRIGELQCTLTVLECPGLLRNQVQGATACLEYDQGTVDACAEFYETLSSCSDFTSQPPCYVGYYNDAPAGCPTLDAGKEAQAEGSVEASAGQDASAEASGGEEASVEASAADSSNDGIAAE